MIDYSKLQKYVEKVMGQEMKKDANVTQEIMRGEVPIDTGTLQASIGITGSDLEYKVGHRPQLLIARSGVDYANFVYYGTKKQRPNRWIERTMAKLPLAITKTRSTI